MAKIPELGGLLRRVFKTPTEQAFKDLPHNQKLATTLKGISSYKSYEPSLCDLFSPTEGPNLFEATFRDVIGEERQDPSLVLPFLYIVSNLIALIDSSIKLSLPAELNKINIQTEFNDDSIKVRSENNAEQVYEFSTNIRASHRNVPCNLMVGTKITEGQKYIQQILLTVDNRSTCLHPGYDFHPDFMDINALSGYFQDASEIEQGAFLFEKAKRLLELKANADLRDFVPPLFFMHPAQIQDEAVFNSRLDKLKQELPAYCNGTLADPKLIARSAHLAEGGKVALSKVFTSIPNLEMSYSAFKAAINQMQQDRFRLDRVNLSLRAWEKLSMNDLGSIVMPTIPAKYFIKIEPVVYNSDRASISEKPTPKKDQGDKVVSYEIKIFSNSGSGPGKLLYRSDLNNLTLVKLNEAGVLISDEQVKIISDFYSKLSSIYSGEFQEAEFLVGQDGYANNQNHNIHLVQTRDQAAIEKHPDDDVTAILKKYKIEPGNIRRDVQDVIKHLFLEKAIPIIVIDEQAALANGLSIEKYKKNLLQETSKLKEYQLFIKSLSRETHAGAQQLPFGHSRLVSCYEDLADASSYLWVTDPGNLCLSSTFHNLYYGPKSRNLTTVLNKGIETSDFVGDYDPKTGLCSNPKSPFDLIQHAMGRMVTGSSLEITEKILVA